MYEKKKKIYRENRVKNKLRENQEKRNIEEKKRAAELLW